MSTIEITTKSGFACEVNPKKIKDYRFVKIIRNMVSEDQTKQFAAVTDMGEYILGEEGVSRLVKHVEDDEGFSSVEDVNAELTEIIDILKNKSSDVKN